MKKLLWLDDYRDPFGDFSEWLMFSPIGQDVEVHWVKNYEEFTKWIYRNGLPDGICFDHDLDDQHYTPEELWTDYAKSKQYQEAQKYTEKTGYDCAKFLTEYCIDYSKELPKWYSHSANPVGRDNIDRLLINFLRRV